MSELYIDKMTVGAIDTNCYFVVCKDTEQLAIVDPGADGKRIAAKIKEAGWQPTMILNTHGHWDHIGANKYLQDQFSIPIFIHEADLNYLSDAGLSMAAWLGSDGDGGICQKPLADGDEIKLGRLSMQVIHTPGHTPGGVSFYLPQQQILLCGDTLFDHSIGRTDLPGGDMDLILESISKRLFVLPDAVIAYPGHGPETTIGEEKKGNPFVKAI
jgi:hydroxyacylglutathione hydrolase